MKISHCDFPEDLLYDVENFVWCKTNTESGMMTIGIINCLGYISGKLSNINLKPIGITVERGKSIGTIESSRYFGVVRSPVSGKIIEINSSLSQLPELANKYPYTQGWFARLKVTKIDEGIKSLKNIKSCSDEIAALIQRHHIICFDAFPDFELFEIGVECAATLAKLDELLEKIAVGSVVHLVSDDPTADLEMIRWSEQTGQSLLDSRREGNLFHFTVKKTQGEIAEYDLNR
jgi:glycine cleavage system H lipoate-binding protein/TusA-related sulfurtransferase